jgi:hypothetical protein
MLGFNNMLCAICADKVVGWKLYKDITGGLKTQNILDFYDEFIKDNYKNYLTSNLLTDFGSISEATFYLQICFACFAEPYPDCPNIRTVRRLEVNYNGWLFRYIKLKSFYDTINQYQIKQQHQQ